MWLPDVGIRAVLTRDWLVGKGEAVGHSDGVGIMAIAKVPSSSLGAAEVQERKLGIWLPLQGDSGRGCRSNLYGEVVVVIAGN